jgi:uncharacterized protein YndB with AHSA1/START domain
MTTIIEKPLVLELSRRFDAPPERVYDAWLGASWGEWLGPAGARCESVSGEARVGAPYTVAMIRPDGQPVEITGVYKKLARPKTIAFTWASQFCNGGSLVTLTFEPDGAGTLMKFRQEGFDNAETRDGHNSGWNGEGASFDRLDAFLARTAG